MEELEKDNEEREGSPKKHKPKGHKGLYKRGSVWWIRYAGLDGKIIRESTGCAKFKDAETKLIEGRNGIKEGKQPEIRRIENFTFNELKEEYLKWAERQRSFKSKQGFIKQLGEAFRNLSLRRFNPMLIEQYQTERLQRGKKTIKMKLGDRVVEETRPNKPATANRLIATLKHMSPKLLNGTWLKKQS